MAYTLKIEHPDFPTGDDATEFGVNGLGRIKNGESLEIDEDMERSFVASRGKTVEDAFKDTPGFELSGSSTINKDELEQLLPPVPVEEEVPAETQGQQVMYENTATSQDKQLGGEQDA